MNKTKFFFILPSSFFVLLPILRQRIHFKKAGAAVNRAILRREKRHGRVAAAFGAMDGDFDFMLNACFVGGENRIQPGVFGLFAILTSLRRILQTFVAEKFLLAARPDKIFFAVDAGNTRVFGIRLVGESFLCKFFEIGSHHLFHRQFLILFFNLKNNRI